MKKIIGLIPTIINRRKTNNLIVDINLINFLNECFPKNQLKILSGEKINTKIDLIVSSGGNSIVSINKSKENNLRKVFDQYYLKYSIMKNIPFLGICYGAQYVANYYKSKIIKKRNHTKKEHTIFFDKSKKNIKVNSYHDYSIIKLGKELEKIAFTKDGSIEAFKHKNKKILGIMWHPERYKKIKKFDIEFIKKYL